ncbi:hypothetical protein IHV10_20230 [Fictibacillus sp. 5RED26]|uniref:hypothetical protein n=1 Tax=Fictibacillus sp. 5RED26 TaxID=2745876 RepID=UPI0018CE5D39|nr:hypothetical protein [Fictibacillus sp. 5RED26]MBH0158715.1 hypothetical protein [Fictibacillus sp. 5RED26]
MIGNDELGLLVEVKKPFLVLETSNKQVVKIEVQAEKDNPEYWEALEANMAEGLYLPFNRKTKQLTAESEV